MKVGELMTCWGIGKVIESYKPEFKKGDLVWGFLAWSEYMLFENPHTRYPPGLTILSEEQAKCPSTYTYRSKIDGMYSTTKIHRCALALSFHPPTAALLILRTFDTGV